MVRQKNHPRTLGRRSRFFGSSFWQAYFVEAVILSVVLLGILLRTIEYALLNNASYVADHPEAADHNGLLHFPPTAWLGELLSGLSLGTLENLVYFLAMVKIVVSMTWLIVDRPQHHHGRGLAPVHRVVQHLLQARGRRRHRAGCAASR